MLIGRQLSCRRGGSLLFRGLNISVVPGSIHWLRGPNGSGKTSLLRILAGLSAPAAGQVQRPALLYLGHGNALSGDLSLTAALEFHARLQGLTDARGVAQRALQHFGLAAQQHARVRTLSQGQRRRGALARLALDSAARAWLLDEPYDALDSAAAERLSMLIVEHAQRGGSVLLASHQPVSLPKLQVFDLPILNPA